jgi:hypothetical protein
VEFAIVAGEGGRGTLWLADLNIEDCSPTDLPVATASSAVAAFPAAHALDGAGWRPLPHDPRPWIAIDLVQPRSVGGLTIDWLGEAPRAGFRVRASTTGHRWTTLHTAPRAGGKRSHVYTPGLTTRYLRLELGEPAGGAVLKLRSFDFSRSIEAFWYHIADAETRGWHPRWLHREQTLWTPIGTSHGTHCAVLNDDGMLEVEPGSFSIEPMLSIAARLYTWADVTARQELPDRRLPAPCVIWETTDWRLRIGVEATVSGGLRVRYRLTNLTARPVCARLFLVVRPFQVTPPWQNFHELGGVSRIHDLAWRDGAVWVNDTTSIAPASQPTAFGCLSFDEGCIAARLLAGELPRSIAVHDAFGFASGVLEFALPLGPMEAGERVLYCPPRAAERSAGERVLNGPPRAAERSAGQRVLDGRPCAAEQSAGEAAFDWGTRLALGQWAGNGWLTEVIDAALTATAHILVTRSGPALQPGPRRYTRSWIRDGAMMSAALLRMRHTDEVRDFIRWYAPHQRADGFVPCCVDADGIDWLVEHDSHGQLIALIADYHRFVADPAFREESWIFVERAVGCIEGLLGADGLLPVSVSHEGYLAQPVHSYWDDFWALRGLRDAVALAEAGGRPDTAQRWQALAARFSAAVYASIEATRAQRRLDFIPGSIEWADFDPTATANALYLLDLPGLNRGAVERTFDKYLADWHAKRSGRVVAANYTPYEIRIIGALVRLGRREAALELLEFFLSDRRPPAWNQWPEIAWRDRTAPAHVGDLPHTWIAAEYVLAVRCLFGYEREADAALILAAGLAAEWLDGAGVVVNAMPTAYGDLSYALRRLDARTLRFDIGGTRAAAIVLRPPLVAPLQSVRIDGVACSSFDSDSVTVLHTPAEVICIQSLSA